MSEGLSGDEREEAVTSLLAILAAGDTEIM